MDTISTVLSRLPKVKSETLPAPEYTGKSDKGIALAVESMKRHMTDEGWQIMQSLQYHGYTLCGHQLEVNATDVRDIIRQTDPGIVLVQDKREWDVQRGDFRVAAARFNGVGYLKERPDLFKLTILKDSHQRPDYHRESADEMGVHAWVIYYHPSIVMRNAPYLRQKHLIRTYHTLDANLVPDFSMANRGGVLLSGAISPAYPLRSNILRHGRRWIPNMTVISHPGYHVNGSATPKYLQTLSHYKVAICTASMYGYALRKIIEATACGCRVVTDLPVDEVLPEIDGNLIRVPSDINMREIGQVVRQALVGYEPGRQERFAKQAKAFYDYRVMGQRLVQDISNMAKTWSV